MSPSRTTSVRRYKLRGAVLELQEVKFPVLSQRRDKDGAAIDVFVWKGWARPLDS